MRQRPPNIEAHSTADALNGFLSNRRGSLVNFAIKLNLRAVVNAPLGRWWPRWQFFRFIQVMLDGRQRLLSKLLHVGVIPARRIFFEEITAS